MQVFEVAMTQDAPLITCKNTFFSSLKVYVNLKGNITLNIMFSIVKLQR